MAGPVTMRSSTGLGSARTTALFAVFVSFGSVFGLIGPAWVGMGPDLGLEPEALPIVTVPLIVGRMLGALAAPRIGLIVPRAVRFVLAPVVLGAGQIITAGVFGGAVTAAAIGLALTGLAGGLLDVTVNEVLAEQGDQREATLVHGGYGVGAIAGPLLLVVGFDWSAAFVIGGLGAMASALVAPVADAGRNRRRRYAHEIGPAAEPVEFGPIAWGLTLAAGLIGAVEVISAQWAPTVLAETAGWSEAGAGAIGATFWFVLTAVRLIVGLSPWRPDLVDGAAIRIVAVAGGVLLLVGGVGAAGGAVLIAAGVSTGLPFLVVEAGRRAGPAGISASLVAAALASALGLALLGPLTAVTSVRASGAVVVAASLAAMVLWPRRAASPTGPAGPSTATFGPHGDDVE